VTRVGAAATATRLRLPALGIGLGATVVLLFAVSLAVGSAPVLLAEAVADLLAGRDSLAALVLVEIRLPRALLAVMIGASLGLTGAAMQGLLRNPLAEPGIVGVSGCAALGAVVVFYSGLAALVPFALPLGGIAGALGAVALLYALAGPGAGTLTLILAGVALNALAAALTALALNLSPNPYATLEIVFWLMGSLADRSLAHVWLALPLMLAGWALVVTAGRPLDALSLGEDTARSLGFNLDRVRIQLVLGTALAVGSAVAVAGAIGFVGLVVPHLLRPLVGHQPSRLLGLSALGGAAITLAADIAVRLAGGPELKLGVLTALIGAPFFLALVLRMRHEAAT